MHIQVRKKKRKSGPSQAMYLAKTPSGVRLRMWVVLVLTTRVANQCSPKYRTSNSSGIPSDSNNRCQAIIDRYKAHIYA